MILPIKYVYFLWECKACLTMKVCVIFNLNLPYALLRKAQARD